MTTNPKPASELLQPEKTAAVLMTMEGEAARSRYLTLNGDMNELVAQGAAWIRFQQDVALAKPQFKESSDLLTHLNEATIAFVGLEHPAALSRLPPADSPPATPDFIAGLLMEILAEVNSKAAQAAAVVPRRMLAHYKHCREALTTAQSNLAAATEKELSTKLHLITFTADCKEFIHDQTTANHPARQALKRKVTRPVDPAAQFAIKIARKQKQQAKAKAKAQAKVDMLTEREAELRAALLKQVGLEPSAVVASPVT